MKFYICDGMPALEVGSEGIPRPILHRYGLGLGDKPPFHGLLRFSALVVSASLQITRRSSCLRRPITVLGNMVCGHGKKRNALWHP
jgi:hypothetical protein